MNASLDILTPSSTTLIRARTDDPVTISTGATLSYGTTSSLGSTLSAGQSLTITADTYVRSAGAVLIRHYDEWENDDTTALVTVAANLAAHEADTTSVHGIANSAVLARTSSNETITGAWTFQGSDFKVSEADGLLHRLVDIAGAGNRAAAHYWHSSAGLESTGLAWVTGIDIGASVPYRDLVLAGKTGYPSAGNVKDFIYVCHNGASDQPTLGIGPGISPSTIGTNYTVVIKPDDADEATVGNLRLMKGDTQTGDLLAITGTSATKQVWIASDYATTIQSSATTPFKVQTNAPTVLLKTLSASSGAVVAPVPVSMGAGAPDAPTAQLDIVETSTTDAVVKVRTASNGSLEIRSEGDTAAVRIRTLNASSLEFGANSGVTMKIGTAGELGFYGATPVAKQTGVAVTAGGIHAALVNLGLIAA